MKATVLVLANRTAASGELIAALRERAERRPARFELVMPPERAGAAARQAAEERLAEALEQARAAGLELTGRVADDCDALAAATEAYDPLRHDEVLVATLPAGLSHWLAIDLPARLGRATGALVSHVVAREPARAH